MEGNEAEAKDKVPNWEAGFTVFVGGIPGNITRSEVVTYFSKFGKINNLFIPYKKETPDMNLGYCFISFEYEESQSYVLRTSEHFLGPRRVSCRRYLNRASLSQQSHTSNERKVFVKFIPSSVSEARFREYFEEYGPLESCYIISYVDPRHPLKVPKSSFGYITFKDKQTCDKVVAQMFFKIEDFSMKVEKYDPFFNRDTSLQKKSSAKKDQSSLKDSSSNCQKESGKDASLLDRIRLTKPIKKSYFSYDCQIEKTNQTESDLRISFEKHSNSLKNLRFNCQTARPGPKVKPPISFKKKREKARVSQPTLNMEPTLIPPTKSTNNLGAFNGPPDGREPRARDRVNPPYRDKGVGYYSLYPKKK